MITQKKPNSWLYFCAADYNVPCACVEFKKSWQVPSRGEEDNDQDVRGARELAANLISN